MGIDTNNQNNTILAMQAQITLLMQTVQELNNKIANGLAPGSEGGQLKSIDPKDLEKPPKYDDGTGEFSAWYEQLKGANGSS